MDPDVYLAEIRALIAKLHQNNSDTSGDYIERAETHAAFADALAARVSALDSWLKSGGGLPSDWAQPKPVIGTVISGGRGGAGG